MRPCFCFTWTIVARLIVSERTMAMRGEKRADRPQNCGNVHCEIHKLKFPSQLSQLENWIGDNFGREKAGVIREFLPRWSNNNFRNVWSIDSLPRCQLDHIYFKRVFRGSFSDYGFKIRDGYEGWAQKQRKWIIISKTWGAINYQKNVMWEGRTASLLLFREFRLWFVAVVALLYFYCIFRRIPRHFKVAVCIKKKLY